MSLQFPYHDDVIFKRAPLSEVMCKIEFPPITALSEMSSIIGFQEALRSYYPKFSYRENYDVTLSENMDELSQRLPIWSLHDNDENWEVSLGLDFIGLSTTDYSHFDEFSSRLVKVLQALERTFAPDRSTWIGLRKANQLRHPTVTESNNCWDHLIRSELLGLLGAEGPPCGPHLVSTTAHATAHLFDDRDGIMTMHYGIYNEELTYTLDIDYGTTESFSMDASNEVLNRLRVYSDTITSCFHWCLKPEMIEYLKPQPRNEVINDDH